MKAKKRISILLFLIGFGIFLYPFISRTYYDIYFRSEVEKITESFVNDELSEILYNEQVAYNQSEISNPEAIEYAEVSFMEESYSETKNIDYLANENVLGIVSAPAINLVYPIYDGATDQNLLDGVARIEGTSYPVGGINTNSVIAGHNGLAGRTYFSNIKKLVTGDLIKIQNRKETLSYEVYGTAVIAPDDLPALAVIPGQDTITLLTCTWPPPGTHRYLVYGKRVLNKEDEDKDRDKVFISNRESKIKEVQEKTVNNIGDHQKVTYDGESIFLGLKKTLEKIDAVARRYGVLVSLTLIAGSAVYYIFIRE